MEWWITLAVALVLLLYVLTMLYLRVYRPVQLYSVIIPVLPRVATFCSYRALGYLRQYGYETGYEPASRDIERAIQIRPDMPQLYSARGDFYLHQGRYGEAIQEYDRALRSKPRLWASFYHAVALSGRASAWSCSGNIGARSKTVRGRWR